MMITATRPNKIAAKSVTMLNPGRGYTPPANRTPPPRTSFTADTVIAGQATLTKIYPDQTVVVNRTSGKVISITPKQKTTFLQRIMPKQAPKKTPNVSNQVSAGKNLLKEFYPEQYNNTKTAKKPFRIFG